MSRYIRKQMGIKCLFWKIQAKVFKCFYFHAVHPFSSNPFVVPYSTRFSNGRNGEIWEAKCSFSGVVHCNESLITKLISWQVLTWLLAHELCPKFFFHFSHPKKCACLGTIYGFEKVDYPLSRSNSILSRRETLRMHCVWAFCQMQGMVWPLGPT